MKNFCNSTDEALALLRMVDAEQLHKVGEFLCDAGFETFECLDRALGRRRRRRSRALASSLSRGAAVQGARERT